MTRGSERIASILGLLTLTALCACAEPAPRLPNLVFVTLDTTRADHLGLYGYSRDTSPNLDAFAEQSIVFERVLAPIATTLPTHLSLFTATHPLEHGVIANSQDDGGRMPLAPGLRLFAEVAREAGYRTAGFVSAAPLRTDSGVAAGFETYEQPQTKRLSRPGHVTTQEALDWLKSTPRGPYLLWVHLFDAHWPFTPPEHTASLFRTDAEALAWLAAREVPEHAERKGIGPENSRTVLNLYDAELRFQDENLGRLLDGLASRPDWPHTAVVIVGDHGEGLSQHGHPAHGGTWDEQLRVPLLLRVPGQEPRREAALVSVADILPTLLGLLKVDELDLILEQASGQDRLRTNADPGVLSQDSGRFRADAGYRYALTTPRWKYIRVEREQAPSRELLFDLDADPFELRDLAAQQPKVLAEMRERLSEDLARRLERGRALRPDELEAAPPDPGLLQQLQELGYLIDDSEAPGAGDKPDAGG